MSVDQSHLEVPLVKSVMKKAHNSILPTHYLPILVLFIFLSANSFSQTWTSPAGIAKHNGDTVSFIGFVTSARYFADAKDALTVINIGGKRSAQLLTLVVRGDDRLNCRNAPETAYTDRYVQVVGKVQMYKGKPRIILHHEKQISIVTEAAPDIE